MVRLLIEWIARRNEDSAVEKRAPNPSAVDGVNLNMAEGQLAELTFVETREVGKDDVEDEEDDD